MKNLLFTLVILLFGIQSFSQEISEIKNREYYITKRKYNIKGGNISLITGAALTAIFIVIPRGDVVDDTEPNINSTGSWTFEFSLFTKHENDGIKAVVATLGFISMLTSLGFYLSASGNKQKAEKATSLSFTSQRLLFPQQNSVVYKTQPSLTLKIRL